MNVLGICFLIFVSAFAIGHAAPHAPPSPIYDKCDSPMGELISADVSDCTKPPCILNRGSNITIHVTFKTLDDINTVTEDVKGFIGKMPVPFPTPRPDACKNKGFTCPLKKGSVYNYTAVTPVSKIYPQIRLTVQWAIKDNNGTYVFCLQIPAQIK